MSNPPTKMLSAKKCTAICLIKELINASQNSGLHFFLANFFFHMYVCSLYAGIHKLTCCFKHVDNTHQLTNQFKPKCLGSIRLED